MSFNLGRASAKNATNYFVSQVNGLGESKVEARNEGNEVGRNGQDLSNKLHSGKSIDNFRSVTNQYFDHVKAEHGTLKGNINESTATAFIEGKLERGEISGSSANTYLSSMNKIGAVQESIGHTRTIDKESIKDIAETLKDKGYDLSKPAENRAYADPSSIVANMNSYTEHGLSATLQLEAGMRSDDATNSEKWQINQSENTITIHGSKNGTEYTTSVLSNETIDRASQAKDKGYSVSYSNYREELKEATQESWKGTHGLRYNYAQEEMAQKLENGTEREEALKEVSEAMGHSRSEITLHYLSKD